MITEESIKQSKWWAQAQKMPDRHYDPAKGVSLADHLESVHQNLGFLRQSSESHSYYSQLIGAMQAAGQDPVSIHRILEPVALLHDIGKVREEKKTIGKHPISGKPVKMRHPVVGLMAALELLPEGLANREAILSLVEEHDTPFSWYLNFVNSGQVPKQKSWAKLDRNIDPKEDGSGIIMLAVFKLADIDGHESVDDVSWFFDQANKIYLMAKGKWLPVPNEEAIRSLEG